MRIPAFLSNELLRLHLDSLSHEESVSLITSLEPILKAGDTSTLVCKASRFGANQIINEIRSDGTEPCSYLEFLDDCNKKVQAPGNVKALGKLIQIDQYPLEALEFRSNIAEAITTMESQLLKALFDKIYASLTPEQRESFAKSLAEKYPDTAKGPSNGLIAAGGAVLLGNIGGFGTYMAMSTLLSTLSLGALGFGAYTAASSLLSFVLGPVGWAALGATLVHQLGSSDENKMLRDVASIALASQSKTKSPTLLDDVVLIAKDVRTNTIRELDREEVAYQEALKDKRSGTGFWNFLDLIGETVVSGGAIGVKRGLIQSNERIAQRVAEETRVALRTT